MAIQNTSVQTIATPLYTSSGSSAVVTIHLCNYTTDTVVANVYVVPNGDTAGNTNIVYSNYSITSYNTLIINTEKFILGNGDSVYANVSANTSVTATVSYIGI